FVFTATATTEIYTLSLHDALPISQSAQAACGVNQTTGQLNIGSIGGVPNPPPNPPRQIQHRPGNLLGCAGVCGYDGFDDDDQRADRKSTRLNSSHVAISYAVFCLK